jgi:hypothetical protein
VSRACASMAKSDRPIAHMGPPEALSGPLLSASHGRPKQHATPRLPLSAVPIVLYRACLMIARGEFVHPAQ